MTRGVVGIEWIKFFRPLRQDRHEVSPCQQRRQADCEALENALARHAGCYRDGRIIQHQAACDLDLNDLPASVKLPWKRQASLRITEEKDLVMDDVVRRPRLAVPFEIGRRRNRQDRVSRSLRAMRDDASGGPKRTATSTPVIISSR